MGAYVASVEQWAAGLNVELSSGGQVDLFSPNAVQSKTNGDTDSILFELTSSITTAGTMANVQGLLGAIASTVIKDKDQRIVKNWTGPQLAYWYWLKTRKSNPSPSVSGTATATPSWSIRMPCALPSRFGPYTLTCKGAPYGEIATNVSGASISLTVSQIYGRAGPLIHEDYLPLSGLVAGSPSDITNQFPAGQMMDDFSFITNGDSVFTSLTLHKSKNAVFESLGPNYFIQSAFNEEPVGAFSSDDRPSGLFPIPFKSFARGLGDLVKLNLSAVAAGGDPSSGVNQGSAYNPLAILYRETLS